LAEASKLSEVARRTVALEWSALTLGLACRVAPALVVVLAGGLVAGVPAAGAVAAGGALTVGFGAFQQLTTSRAVPMLFALVGICASTFIGTLTGGSAPLTIALAFVYGFWCGMLPVVSMGAFWIGQQCTIYFLIAGAYHGGVDQAFVRAGLVLAGGIVQIALFGAILTAERGLAPRPLLHRVLAEGAMLIVRLRIAEGLRFAPSFAVALAAAVLAERWLDLPNGYWAGMTALILLRPDFHDTLARSIGRVGGTIVGAILASLVAHVLQPGPDLLALLVALCAFLTFGTVRLNFGVFSLFLTAYVIFLLVLAGVTEAQVAEARIEATTLGAAIALVIHFQLYLANRSRAAPRPG
jgi:Fusaric acid resistance protein-like